MQQVIRALHGKTFCMDLRAARIFGDKLAKVESHFVGWDQYRVFLAKRLHHVAVDARHPVQHMVGYEPSRLGVGERYHVVLADVPLFLLGAELQTVLNAAV